MFSEPGTTVVRKRLSFFSVLAISLAAIIVTTIVSASGIAVYGLRLVDKKTDGLIGLVGAAATSLPELREALPPVLADAINDVRRADYLDDLKVSVHLGSEESGQRYRRAVVEVENQGEEIVSLLSMRIVGLDEDGDPVDERLTWAATPIQLGDEWRGPLFPHKTRRFPVRCSFDRRTVKLTHDITDVRVWRGNQIEQANQTALATNVD